MAAVVGSSNASAVLYNDGQRYSTLHNHTNGCVRVYLHGRYYDVRPWQNQQFDVAEPGGGLAWAQVSVFKLSTCGGRAEKTMWFDGTRWDWDVWR